jgi:hypothetical protein
LWTRTYPFQWLEEPTGIDTTLDGGYIMCGHYCPSSEETNGMTVRKVSADGSESWVWLRHEASQIYYATSVIQVTDGTFIVVGLHSSAQSYIYVARLSADGNTIWTRDFSLLDPRFTLTSVATVHEATNHLLRIVGTGRYASPSISIDPFLAEVTLDGELLSVERYNVAHHYRLDAVDFEILSDGSSLIVGHGFPLDTFDPTVLWMIRVNNDGDTMWTRTIAHPSGSLRALSVAATPDNGAVISCELNTEMNYLIRSDQHGDTLWSQVIREPVGLSRLHLESLQNGDIVMCGSVVSPNGFAYLSRISLSGNVIWSTTPALPGDASGVVAAIQTRDRGYIMAISTFDDEENVFESGLVRFDSNEQSVEPPKNVVADNIAVECYPNPFNDVTWVSVRIDPPQYLHVELFDLLGRKVHTLFDGVQNDPISTTRLSATGLPSGVFFIIARTETNNCVTRKTVHLK